MAVGCLSWPSVSGPRVSGWSLGPSEGGSARALAQKRGVPPGGARVRSGLCRGPDEGTERVFSPPRGSSTELEAEGGGGGRGTRTQAAPWPGTEPATLGHRVSLAATAPQAGNVFSRNNDPTRADEGLGLI